VNGLFLQLPIFIPELPEGPALAAYMAALIQLANLVAFGYVILQSYHIIRYSISMGFVLVLSIVVSIFISFFWDHKYMTFGSMHSVGVLTLTFFAGMVGCLSVVIFFPFASQYHPALTSAISTGMGVNALFASIIALIQNPGDHARFGVSWYFAILSILLIGSLLCFLFSLNSSQVESCRIRNQEYNNPEVKQNLLNETSSNPISSMDVLRRSFISIANQFYNCFMNYILISVLPYSVQGYSNSDQLLMWLFTLGMISGSLARFSSAYIKIYHITAINIVQTFFWIFLFTMSFLGKEPNGINGWIIVVANVLFSAMNGYEDTIIYQKVQKELDGQYVERASRFVGLSNQAGAFAGTAVALTLVLTKAL